MSDNSAIEWTDATWNPIVGCSIVSPGCMNCYAMAMAARIDKMTLSSHYEGLTKKVNGKQVWTGKVALANNYIFQAPLRWRKPKRIFVNSMGDLFHESIPDEWIDRVFAVMALAPQHTFQVLTKRAERMREYFAAPHPAPNVSMWQVRVCAAIDALVPDRHDASRAARHAVTWNTPLPNVWLGVSCERQQEADERIPHLLQTPAAIRFVSAEPLLGPIDLTAIPWVDDGSNVNALCGLDWVIVGGESGPRARPMHPSWARSLRDQCATAGVYFFFKQWGEWEWATEENFHTDPDMSTNGCKWVHNDGLVNGPSWHRPDDRQDTDPVAMIRVGKKSAGRLLDGKEHNAFPNPRPSSPEAATFTLREMERAIKGASA